MKPNEYLKKNPKATLKDYVKYAEDNWSPLEGDIVWTVDSLSNSLYSESYYDGMANTNNCFKTEKAAREALKAINEVLAKAKKK